MNVSFLRWRTLPNTTQEINSVLPDSYDQKYSGGSYFRYRKWLYDPFLKAVVKKAKLKQGASVLDVGCGQGFFTGLLSTFGLRAAGVDISKAGVQFARREYCGSSAVFEVADILSLKCEGKFDCVFARGLSLYNSPDFRWDRSTTDILLTHLKPGGVMIFDYHTKLSRKKKSRSWIYHSISDVSEHFSAYPDSRIYFSLRLETILFGAWSFSRPLTVLAALVSQTTGVGGDLIAIVRRPLIPGNSSGGYQFRSSDATT